MLNCLFRIGLTAVLFGLLFVPGVSLAQKEGRPRHVHDEAKLFSKDAVTQANKTIDKIKKSHGKDLFIETVESGEKNKDDRTKWAKGRFNEFGVDGIYVVVSKSPSFYRYYIGDNTREKGYFKKADIETLEKTLSQITKEGKRDDALVEVANYVLEAMNEHARAKSTEQPAPKKKAGAPEVVNQQPVKRPDPPRHEVQHENSMPPWVGWVCTIVAILFVVWIVYAIIRAMTGFGGGGGYGYGGGGYGYGGGGGGFFTGMLGGLFGAMAGMWIYNNFFGGHAAYRNDGSVDWGSGGNDAGGGSSATPYEADTSEGGTGGGGDDDAGGGGGGGDAGGGGGDWGGGGGDDGGGGGGGDWGGGGGDAGGGGDWGGGGGGGDWGGGGGDWGGGGGGDFGGGGGGDW
jgi:TLP18.3/Psb32/MOLO-1 phosphatase superfamily protein